MSTVSSKVSPETPPRNSSKEFFSPSINPSPNLPEKMHPYHLATEFLTNVNSRQVRGLKKKKVHSIVIPGSAEKESKILRHKKVAEHVSKASKHLGLGKKGVPPPLEFNDLKVFVEKPDVVTLENVKKGTKRTFGYHRQGPRKRLYPIKGDKIYSAEKNGQITPIDLLNIRNKYKQQDPKTNPEQFFLDEINKLEKNSSIKIL